MKNSEKPKIKKENSLDNLMGAVAKSQDEQRFNIVEDLQLLCQQYTKISKRDYLQLLTRLLEKYTVTQQAAIHSALVDKCRLGDPNAIKLFYELQAEVISAESVVQIIDTI